MNKKQFEDQFTFTNEAIFEGEIVDDGYEVSDGDEIITIFEHENMLQEYDFASKDTSLYSKIDNQNYGLLFNREKYDDESQYLICLDDAVFISTYQNDSKKELSSLLYLPKENISEYFNRLFKESKNKISQQVNTLRANSYLFNNSISLVLRGTSFIDTPYTLSLYEKYNKNMLRYTSATNLIPAYSIIDSILENLHTYITTRKFDTNKLSQYIVELQNFKDFCPDSVQLCENFISNPKETDLRVLCSSLQKSQKNIDNILSIHLEDKLIRDDEGER